MWKVIDRAQRGFRPARIRYSKLGVTGVVSLVVLLFIFIAGAILDLRGDDAAVRRFGVWARENKRPAVEVITEAARNHRFVFLADVYNADESKTLAADVIQKLAEGPGLDAVLIEVSQDQQPYIDRYFDVAPEDAGVLLAHPRTIHESSAASRAFVELYHRIWLLNQKLGADRRIRVIAADLSGWPDDAAVSPTTRTRRFGERADTMVAVLQREVLAMNSRARVLVFMSGLQSVRSGFGRLQTGGTAPVDVRWFATRLQDRYPGEVLSIVVDANGGGSPDELVQYTGTALPEAAKDVLPNGKYSLRVSEAFDFLNDPIRARTMPGLSFDLFPRDAKLRDLADIYVHLSH